MRGTRSSVILIIMLVHFGCRLLALQFSQTHPVLAKPEYERLNSADQDHMHAYTLYIYILDENCRPRGVKVIKFPRGYKVIYSFKVLCPDLGTGVSQCSCEVAIAIYIYIYILCTIVATRLPNVQIPIYTAPQLQFICRCARHH